MKLLTSLCLILLGIFASSSTQYTPRAANNTIISYEIHIKPLIKNYCLTCHDGTDSYSEIDLSTYKAVKEKAVKGILLKRVNDSNDPMPPMGLLPEADRKLIKDWIQNGYIKTSQSAENKPISDYTFTPPTINPVDIEVEGFQFMQKMKGHWVGKMNLMGKQMDWFAFDYRPISAGHIHGIFEGGSVGNLFTSFFVANYKGTKTIMARNGGILAGIYRTSYFVLEEVRESNSESYYRFVDAYGGEKIMWMELKFKKDKLELNAYTSRMGTYPKPRKHVAFKAKKTNSELSETAAQLFNYPKKTVEKDFSNGMPLPKWESEYATITSASYLWTDLSKDLETLGELSKDPIPINKMPYLSRVQLKFKRNSITTGKKISLYLSKSPITDDTGRLIMEYGYIKMDLMNQVLLFPEIDAQSDEFELTYLHPGDYYLTTFIDNDNNQTPSKGDFSTKSQLISVAPNTKMELNVLNNYIEN